MIDTRVTSKYNGEPENTVPSTRAMLWGMHLLDDAGFTTMVRHRVRKLSGLGQLVSGAGIVASALLGLVTASTGIFVFQYDRFLSPVVGIPIILISFLVPMGLGTVVSCLLSRNMEWRSQRLGTFLAHIQNSWPRELARILQKATSLNVGLSTELQALKIVLLKTSGANRGGEEKWAMLSVYDQASMITMIQNLDGQLDTMIDGSQLALGGDSSELVHRACATAFPGKLEAIIDQLENPSLVKV